MAAARGFEEYHLPTTQLILSNTTEKWSNFAGRGLRLISDDNAQLLDRYCQQPVGEARAQFAEEHGPALAAALLQVLRAVSTQHIIQYALALIDELLSASPRFVGLFIDLRRAAPEFPLGPLIVHSDAQDAYTSFVATKLLAKFMVNANWDVDASVGFRIVKWFTDLAAARDLPVDHLLAGLEALKEFLRGDVHRELFVEQDGLNVLATLLRDYAAEHQILYQAIYCAWLLSFNAKLAADEFARTPIIAAVVATLRTVVTEKVIRVAIGTLRNLVDRGGNNDVILQCGFSRVLAALLARRWGDEDVANDLAKIDDALQKNIAQMSSFDAYHNEIVSGDLSWSPCHKSERFWRENVTRFEDNKCRVLGLLVQFISSSNDPLPLSVALHDLGEFARFHPRGRAIVNQFKNLKARVMELLEHSDPSVQSQALLCCQKIMVHNWEFLPGSSA